MTAKSAVTTSTWIEWSRWLRWHIPENEFQRILERIDRGQPIEV
jgi:hypothetical protein